MLFGTETRPRILELEGPKKEFEEIVQEEIERIENKGLREKCTVVAKEISHLLGPPSVGAAIGYYTDGPEGAERWMSVGAIAYTLPTAFFGALYIPIKKYILPGIIDEAELIRKNLKMELICMESTAKQLISLVGSTVPYSILGASVAAAFGMEYDIAAAIGMSFGFIRAAPNAIKGFFLYRRLQNAVENPG